MVGTGGLVDLGVLEVLEGMDRKGRGHMGTGLAWETPHLGEGTIPLVVVAGKACQGIQLQVVVDHRGPIVLVEGRMEEGTVVAGSMLQLRLAGPDSVVVPVGTVVRLGPVPVAAVAVVELGESPTK